jgi:hypothetical protein
MATSCDLVRENLLFVNTHCCLLELELIQTRMILRWVEVGRVFESRAKMRVDFLLGRFVRELASSPYKLHPNWTVSKGNCATRKLGFREDDLATQNKIFLKCFVLRGYMANAGLHIRSRPAPLSKCSLGSNLNSRRHI